MTRVEPILHKSLLMLIKVPNYDQVTVINTEGIAVFQVGESYSPSLVMITLQGERIEIHLHDTGLDMHDIISAIYDAYETGQRTLDLTDDEIKPLTI